MSGRTAPAEKEHAPLPSPAAAVVRHNFATIASLPDPETTWTLPDLDEMGHTRPDKSTRDLFISHSILRREGFEDVLINSGSARYRKYSVHPYAYKRAQECCEEIDTLPCCGEGTGFRNEGGDLCCIACGTPHPREIIKEVVG